MIKIKEHADLLKIRWKTELCTSKNCWCAIIDTEEEVIWEQDKFEAYVIPSGACPKEVAEHIVKLHNEHLMTKQGD